MLEVNKLYKQARQRTKNKSNHEFNFKKELGPPLKWAAIGLIIIALLNGLKAMGY